MTATRFGLSNPEEAYVSRLLSAAAQSVLTDDPEAHSQLADFLAEPWRSSELAPAPGTLLPWAFTPLEAR
jgi:hypothetical protein